MLFNEKKKIEIVANPLKIEGEKEARCVDIAVDRDNRVNGSMPRSS